MERTDINTPASELIDRLGGTGEVARLCEIEPAAVSQWRHNGILKPRMQFLRLARPEGFTDQDDSAESPEGL